MTTNLKKEGEKVIHKRKVGIGCGIRELEETIANTRANMSLKVVKDNKDVKKVVETIGINLACWPKCLLQVWEIGTYCLNCRTQGETIPQSRPPTQGECLLLHNKRVANLLV